MAETAAFPREGDVFLRGRAVRLVALTEEDVRDTDWYAWFNDEQTTRFMQKHYFPNTRAQQLAYFRATIEGRAEKVQLGIWPNDVNRLVGVVSLNTIDSHQRKAEVSLLIGETSFRRAPISLEAMALLMRHGFDELNLHRIYGGTIAREWADLLIRTLGFKSEGVFRQDVFKGGRYHDVYFVGVLADEFHEAAARFWRSE